MKILDYDGFKQVITKIKMIIDNKADSDQIPEKLSELKEDAKHRTVTDDEKTNWNEKLSTVAGKDVTKGQTKGYKNTKTWEVVSKSRELGEWIGDLDTRTRNLNKESIKTVNGLRPDASGNLKLVIDPYPTDPVVGFNVKSGTQSFELTWTNPKNLDFEGVKIVKNYEHYPANIEDGIEVLDSYGSKNTQKFTDTSIKKGMYTYYRIFPFDYHRNYNMDSGQVGTGLIKAEQTPPSPPTSKEVSYETVTLNRIAGIEFSIDGTRWQTSNVFNNLNSNTSYTFYARKAGTTFLNPSPKSTGLIVKTKIPPFDDIIGSPGNRKLLKGTMEQGWFGEVSASDFISGDELAKKVGITAGTSQNSNGGWLKFAYMGKVEFVAKKTIRYGISWNSINNANAVTGKRTIDIGGKTYKIRLIKGKTEGKQNDSSSYQGSINKGSEWNKLMLPIHKNAPSNWAYKNNVNSPTENWNVGYTDKDLFTHSDAGYGSYSWCQEYGESTSYRLIRGYIGVSCARSYDPSSDVNSRGWRPVLELVR